jgi:hypothetical protein
MSSPDVKKRKHSSDEESEPSGKQQLKKLALNM